MTKTADPLTPELIDEVSLELEIRDYYPDSAEMIAPIHLVRRLHTALAWARDEVTQLREDLHGAMGALEQTEDDLNRTLAAYFNVQGVNLDLLLIDAEPVAA